MSKAALKTWKWMSLVLVCACLCLIGCKGNNSGEAAEKDTDKTAEANAPKDDKGQTGEQKTEEVAEVDDDIYPDFNFALLNDKEQGRFIKLAKAELCPCPGSNTSLHECLQDREARCGIAMNSAQMIAGMVKADFNETDILDKVAELVENAKAKHEFSLEDRPVKGNVDGAVVLVEFADFQCPYCKEASKIIDDAEKKYGEDLAIYFKQFPLQAHAQGELAARASLAAHNQGKFWQMHDALFKNQKSLSESKIISLAQRAGLNMGKFKKDLNSPEVKAAVAKDKLEGEQAGLTGTPTIFLNGRRFMGDGSPEGLFKAIEQAIAEAKAEGTTTDEK